MQVFFNTFNSDFGVWGATLHLSRINLTYMTLPIEDRVHQMLLLCLSYWLSNFSNLNDYKTQKWLYENVLTNIFVFP